MAATSGMRETSAHGDLFIKGQIDLKVCVGHFTHTQNVQVNKAATNYYFDCQRLIDYMDDKSVIQLMDLTYFNGSC